MKLRDEEYVTPEHGWTCFHCGETFTTVGAARDHFGFDICHEPACRIKLGAERGLVMAIRKAEAEIEELRRLLHDESSEAYRMYMSQAIRHRDQLQTMEELGYERGLRDGRAEHPISDNAGELLKEADALLDNLWQAVPWGATSNLDIEKLNIVPGKIKRWLQQNQEKLS